MEPIGVIAWSYDHIRLLAAGRGGAGINVDQTEKKTGRRKTAGTAKKMSQAAGNDIHPSDQPKLGPRLPSNLQAHIGRHLRAAFDEVAREPLPDRLLQLLKDLEQDGDK
jgi:hypothetical protein